VRDEELDGERSMTTVDHARLGKVLTRGAK
jgi:hypothetical protein